MNLLLNEELTAIRERAEKATEGPWEVTKFNYVRSDYKAYGEDDYIADVNENEDAAFIAHAREDIPKLLAEIERLKSVVSEVITDNIYHETDEEFDEIYRRYLYGGDDK